MIALSTIHPCQGKVEGSRWLTINRLAVWIIRNAYLSFSFDNSVQWWSLEGGRNLFRESLYMRIMTDRTISLSKRYIDLGIDEETFWKVWKQRPWDIKTSRGPECMLGPGPDPPPTKRRRLNTPEPDLDGIHGWAADSDWDTA